MHVAELWRFPVKSMAGEPPGRADVRPDGIAGDRVAYVLGAPGRIVTARTRPRVLGHPATPRVDGEPPVGGRPWRAPGVGPRITGGWGGGGALTGLGARPGKSGGGDLVELISCLGRAGPPRRVVDRRGDTGLFREAGNRPAENVELRRPAGLEVDQE